MVRQVVVDQPVRRSSRAYSGRDADLDRCGITGDEELRVCWLQQVGRGLMPSRRRREPSVARSAGRAGAALVLARRAEPVGTWSARRTAPRWRARALAVGTATWLPAAVAASGGDRCARRYLDAPAGVIWLRSDRDSALLQRVAREERDERGEPAKLYRCLALGGSRDRRRRYRRAARRSAREMRRVEMPARTSLAPGANRTLRNTSRCKTSTRLHESLVPSLSRNDAALARVLDDVTPSPRPSSPRRRPAGGWL